MKKLQALLLNNDEIDLRKIFPEAIYAVTQLIIQKLNVINA